MAVTDGGGAAAVVVDIVNTVYDNASTRMKETNALIAKAIGAADPAPRFDPVLIQSDYEAKEAPDFNDTIDGAVLYENQRAQLTLLISNAFTTFFDKFIPIDPSFQGACNWLQRALTAGGTGINTNVESALWQRGRARILSDSSRAAAEAEQVWANRRFPVPPGALLNQLNEINLDAGRKLAEQSRDISVKSFEAELENVKLAVVQALDLRLKAIAAAGDYIKTLMLGPQTAMQLATGLAGLEVEMNKALVQMYTAEVTAAEPAIRLAIAQGDMTTRALTANLDAAKASVDAKVRAIVAGAQMAAAQASAGINAVNAQASISGQDSSQV